MSRQASAIITLNEATIHHMASAALEMALDPPLETMGYLLGEMTVTKRHRKHYHVRGIHVLQRGRKTADPANVSPQISYGDRHLKILKKNYPHGIIGDFHSHPGRINSPLPGHQDLRDVLAEKNPDFVFAIIHIFRNKGQRDSNSTEIINRKTKVICRMPDFIAYINFYTLKPGIIAIRYNRKSSSMVQRVFPRCNIRKKIRSPRPQNKTAQ